MLESLRRQKHRRRRQGDDRHPHAVADRLGAEGVPRHRIEDADQIRRHRNRRALFADHAPRHDPFVLKRDLQTRAAVLIEPLDDAAAAQKSLGSAPRHIDDFAAEQLFPLLLIQNCRDRILVVALRLAHPPPISKDMTARNLTPEYSSCIATARAMLRLSARRSWPTSGAPMLETTATKSLSARSSGDINSTRYPSA